MTTRLSHLGDPVISEVRLAEILRALGDELVAVAGPHERMVVAASPLESADRSDFAFCSAPGTEGAEKIQTSQAGVVICRNDALEGLTGGDTGGRTLVAVQNPRRAFARVLKCCFAPSRPTGIHPEAIVDSRAEIGSDAHLGPACVVGNCRIGARSVIHARAALYDGVSLGPDCTVHAGAVLGADGFGYERDASGEAVKFPHLGTVEIHGNVEIGANTCIDRGALGATVIAKGVKIDDLCYVAHNVVVGRDALLMAGCRLAGSVNVGPRAEIGMGASIRQGTKIGADAQVGMGAVVLNDVPPGVTVVGVPARSLAQN